MTSTILEAVLNEHEDETLDHHGVKGMKWGRRKKRETSGSARPKANRTPLSKTEKLKRRDMALAAAGGAATSVIRNLQVDKSVNKSLPRGFSYKTSIGNMALDAVIAGSSGALYAAKTGRVRRQVESSIRNNKSKKIHTIVNSAASLSAGVGMDLLLNDGRRVGNANKVIKRRNEALDTMRKASAKAGHSRAFTNWANANFDK